MFTNNDELHQTLFYHHNFGHKGQLDFHGLGINAKMSELQAAMGLAVLPYMDSDYRIKKKNCANLFTGIRRFRVQFLRIRENTEWNYSYFPVIFESEEILLKIEAKLLENNIGTRRYFYPSLNKLPYINSGCFPVQKKSVREFYVCLCMENSLRLVLRTFHQLF